MVVEALSFKFALDFLQYLSKNRISAFAIRVLFWDRTRYEMITFEDITKMFDFFRSYSPIDKCLLGDLCSIQSFEATSNLFAPLITDYKAVDITNLYKLTAGSSFNAELTTEDKIKADRQISFINQAVAEYLKFFNEIKQIYVTGIYSPCYAAPGWTQNTWYLKSLKEKFLVSGTDVQFPYSNVIIEKKPPF